MNDLELMQNAVSLLDRILNTLVFLLVITLTHLVVDMFSLRSGGGP